MTALRLVAFDLDGTLTRGDTICEAIARRIGRLERMREIERGVPLDDPRDAGREMVSWYRAHPRGDLLAALEDVRLAPGAQEGLRRLHERGVVTAIVSLTWMFAVEWFAGRLGVGYHAGTGLTEDGQITHFWPEDKARWLVALAKRLSVDPAGVAAVGDSAGDIPMLRSVGHAFFVGEALPRELAHAAHRPAAHIGELVDEILGR